MKKSLIMMAATAALLAACSPSNDLAAMARGGYAFRPERIKIDPHKAVAHGYWDRPSGLEGEHLIVIDTQLQQAKYYIANQQVGSSTISSGKAGHGTPAGSFKILSKDEDHKSSTYGSVVDADGNTLIADYTKGQPMPEGGIYKGADMNFGMQITTTGIWMHEGYVTSAPESHGCIRLPRDMAKIFFDNTPVGTRVVIK
ncbi:MAG: L,D-transpeptidase family protein [Akkermansia sp.]|nr:L,D-transpeptidase family protein [Akkermansia sp.]